MKRLVGMSCLAVALIVSVAAPGYARGSHGFHHGFHHGGRVFIGVGPAFWWGPPYWYYPPYYAPPPTVVVEEPPVYVQQSPPVAAPPAESYWYYCVSAKAYYPNVPSCPEAWVKVPAQQ